MRAWTPTLAKRWIGSELRRLRNNAGISQKAAADRLGRESTRMTGLESGLIVPHEHDLEVLLPLYGAPDRVQEFIKLRTIAKQSSWWTGTFPVPKLLGQYLGFEEGAAEIDIWDGIVIPPLLQTFEYAYAQLRESMLDSPLKEVTDQVALRMRRQEIWRDRGEDRAQLRVVLSEAALRLSVGFTTVMREQYDHLLELATSTVKLQLLPFSAGAHAAPFSPFSLLRFDIPDDIGVLYTENTDGGHCIERAQDIDKSTKAFETLWVKALNPEDSIEFIKRLRSELDKPVT